jgi:hypothetical protein
VQGSQVSGEIPVASVPAASGYYIQNQNASAQSADFKISGNGTAGTFNAATQYNLGGSRILSAPGTNNLFAGVNAGAANTSGCCSTFYGFNAGAVSNANDSSFFGNNAGAANTNGFGNSFFGSSAGYLTTGPLFTAYYNSFFGVAAGQSNTTGAENTIVGAYANVGAGDLFNATAIGAGAIVSQSNSLVLGFGANVGIGTSTPSQLLHINSVSSSAAALVQTPAGAFAQYQSRHSFEGTRH